jgi:predicted nucleic acid-binding protein
MTTFVVDAGAVLQLVSEPVKISSEHDLPAAALLRSQALSRLHEAASRAEISAKVAHEHRARIRQLPIRLLGDAVLQRRAWDVADQLGWASTYKAEYIALTQLHGEALVTLDEELVTSVVGIVSTAPIDAHR